VRVGVLVGVEVGGTDTVLVMVGVSVMVGAALVTVPDTVQVPSKVSETAKKPSNPRLEGTPLKSARHTALVPPPFKITDPLGLAEVGGLLSFPG
jgi:hypothetical protein